MFKNIFMEVFNDTWPTMLIAIVIAVSLRIAYLMKSGKKIVFYRELFMLIFIIYALCLFHVVTYQDINYGTDNFVPFKEIFRYEFGSAKFIRNIIGNILLFVPYGFFTAYFLKSKKISTVFILTVILTVSIEIVQYNIGRVFDIDDIILNVSGGILGYLFYAGTQAIKNKLPDIFRKDGFINIIIIIVIVIIIIYSFDINLVGLFS